MALTAAEIEDLVERFPLAPNVPDAVLNLGELADFFDVMPLTIGQWRKAGMPVLREGGQGQEYEFQASACWAWKQARDQGERVRSEEARASIVAQRLALTGGSSGDSVEALDPKQRREIIAVQIEQERLATHRKQLLKRADVAELLVNLFSLCRDTMEAAPDRVERIEAMPAKAMQTFIEICDGVIEEFGRKIDRFWELNRETGPDRQDLFDTTGR